MWKDDIDALRGTVARMAEQSISIDEASQVRDHLRTISNELRRQIKSIETRIETSLNQALRAVGPMNDERFKTLVDERAIRVYPTKMRDVAERYQWEKHDVETPAP